MKFFIWTVVAKKLLTNQQRMHRNLTTDPSCFHCPSLPETMLHLFRDCPKAKMVWSSFSIPTTMAATFSLSWDAWIHANLLQNRCFHHRTPWNIFFIFTCWHIWKWRCKCIFDSRFNIPYDIQSIIFSYIMEWNSAPRKILRNLPRQTVVLKWENPPPGVMKINTDGSVNRWGNIGAGGIIRDNSGAWHGGFMVHLGTGDILQAEAWGIYYGMQLAIRGGHQDVIFESDSASLINLLTKAKDSMHPLGTVISNCTVLAGTFHSCSFHHIHREKNNVADHLAKSSHGNDKGIIWLNNAPPHLIEIITDDINGVGQTRNIPADIPFCFVNEEATEVNVDDNNIANEVVADERYDETTEDNFGSRPVHSEDDEARHRRQTDVSNRIGL